MMGVGPVFGGANLASAWSGSSLLVYNGLFFVFFIEGVESGGRSCFLFVPAQLGLIDSWEICAKLSALLIYRLSPG